MAMTDQDTAAAHFEGPCLQCGSHHLARAARRRALCLDCRRCWATEESLVRRVRPSTCMGCPLRASCRAPLRDGQGVLVLSVRRHHRALAEG